MKRLSAAELRKSGLFNSAWYLVKNPDVMASGMDPAKHYLNFGWKERRNPNPLFDVANYLDRNQDVAAAGCEPLTHYIRYGHKENREFHPHFDAQWYREQSEIDDLHISPLAHYLTKGRAAGFSSSRREMPSTRPVVLMVHYSFPKYDKGSGAIDQLSFAKIFQNLGYDVHFLALYEYRDFEPPEVKRYRDALASRGVLCLSKDDFHTLDDYLLRHSDKMRVIFLSGHFVASNVFDILRPLCPSAKIIFNSIDIAFLREQRQSEVTGDMNLSAIAAKTRSTELALIAKSDATIVVSGYEQEMLRSIGCSNIFMVPIVREFNENATSGFGARSHIAFVGGYSHPPNIDAVEYFLSAVWPALHAKRPDIELFIAGADMSDKFALRNDPNVRFVGYIKDIETFLERIRLTVAPLRFGAGAKGKVVLSLGEGVPCVASPIAAEGMGLQEGFNISIAKDPDEYLAEICALYDDEKLWSERSENGRIYIRKEYSVDRGTEIVREMFDGIGVKRSAA